MASLKIVANGGRLLKAYIESTHKGSLPLLIGHPFLQQYKCRMDNCIIT